MQNNKGLPVAFVIRRILNARDKDEVLRFLQHVSHASGQNYLVGIKDEVFDFEASANKVVQFLPKNSNGSVYHTNHPLVNDDIKPWFKSYNPKFIEDSSLLKTDSHKRFAALKHRMAIPKKITSNTLVKALRSKDDEKSPICKPNNKDGRGFTFASVVMILSDNPYLKITSGPPNESGYMIVDFID